MSCQVTPHSSGSELRPAVNVATHKHKQEDAEAQTRCQPVTVNLNTHWLHHHRYTQGTGGGSTCSGQNSTALDDTSVDKREILRLTCHRWHQTLVDAPTQAPGVMSQNRKIRKPVTSDLLVLQSVPQWEEASSLKPHFRSAKKVRSVSILGARRRRPLSTWKRPLTGGLSLPEEL